METTRRFGHEDAFAAIGVLSFLAARFMPLLQLHYVCPFKALTGLPCATCGMTHAFVYLAHGKLAAAARASPLGALLAAGFWLFAIVDGVRLAAGLSLPSLRPQVARALAWGCVAAFLANWAFLMLAQLA
ncbi:MAG TPA: DUF2752 domain-containing protein [Anaeromyxobacteraceae bacterium]|nr:DUF2752 domain-containing protein [Anaeromyxobacteraceae bacterium]